MQIWMEITIADFFRCRNLSFDDHGTNIYPERGMDRGEGTVLKKSGFSGVETSLCSRNGKHWHLNWDKMHSAGV